MSLESPPSAHLKVIRRIKEEKAWKYLCTMITVFTLYYVLSPCEVTPRTKALGVSTLYHRANDCTT